MRKKIIFIKLACILFLMALPSNAAACRCPGPISIDSAYQRADVVLRGKVLTVKGDKYKEGAIASIRVINAWKKRVPGEVDVFTSTTCAFDFQTGEEYLLYLYETPEGKCYSTKKCVGNLPISEAKKALSWLERNGLSIKIDD